MANEETSAEPVGRPSPAAPAPTAPASETKTEVDAAIPSKTHINARVCPRRGLSPRRRAIGVGGIVIRHVPGIRVGRLNVDGRLSVLVRSEEHTSELQSLRHLVCRLLLEKK